MTFEELLLALEEHSNLISNETKIGHNTNVRVGLLGKKVAEILRKQGDAGERYLSKIDDDIAKGIITFLKGIVVGDFNSGLFGSGGAIRNINGTTVAEFDQLLIRQRAEFLSVLIHQAKHIGGELILSAAEMVCIKMEETTDFYRCYFDADGGKVVNLFENTDYARHQVFTGNKQKFYWRKVVAVGPDYIELSKTDAAVNSDVPAAGEYIFQLGSENTERQGAIILSTVGPDAPSIKQYVNINTYALSSENEYTVFSRMGNKIQGKTVFRSNGLNYDDWADGTSQDIQDAQAAAAAAALKAQQAIDEAAANVVDYNTKFAEIQAQVDGEISNYSYPYKPTLLNYPASEWTTDIEKDRHVGDTFYNSQAYVDDVTTPDAGKAWRFIKDGTTYLWTPIADSDTVKAMKLASQAQSTADGKSTTFLIQPTKYKLGDMWVLNADRTVNGTAYKQGEILTATQNSTTFNEAHWLKRVRYTDDTAVNNLEIGGRNLLPNSAFLNSTDGWVGNLATLSMENGILKILFDRVHSTPGIRLLEPLSLSAGTYTLGVKGNYDNIINKTFNLYFIGGITGDYSTKGIVIKPGWSYNTVTFTITSPIINSTMYLLTSHPNIGDYVLIDYLTLVEGSKSLIDWTPSPEDVEASIETAKTEAENAAQAYANTKAEAERILAEAYADDIVTDEEQARIDDVNDKLALAKEYAEAQDALLKTQQEAYADGEISKAEQAAIQAAEDYADLKKTEAQAYADGIVSDEEARAIADALDKYNASKAHAETLVNNIEIGGRNYISGNGNHSIRASRFITIPITTPLSGQLTLSASRSFIQGTSDYSLVRLLDSDGNDIQASSGTALRGEGFISRTFSISTLAYTMLIYAGESYAGSNGVYVDLNKLKLEKGNKATDWSPAPEDVQAEIDGLGGYMEGAFQDSVIDKAEAKAIGEHLKTINDRYVTDNAVYNNLIANSFLVGGVRTTLQNVMQNIYRRDKPLLETAINNIVNNKTVTTPLRTAFNTAFTNYRSAITDFQTAVENARKAIEEQRVDNIEIGGRNLIILSKTTKKATIDLDNGGIGASDNHTITDFIAVVPSERYIISVHPPKDGYQQAFVGKLAFYNDNKDFISAVSLPTISTANPYIFESTADTAFIRYSTNTNYALPIEFIKLEKGNKPTDWTEAPEDVDKKISDADAKAADAQAKANKSAAITDKFATEINGGLITTVMMLLREVNSQINTAGFSGIQDDGYSPAYWSGGKYEQALAFSELMRAVDRGDNPIASATLNAEMSSIALLHNGHAKLGELIVKSNGQIVILDKIAGKIKFVINSQNIPSIADLMDDAVFGKTEDNIAVGGITDTITLTKKISVTKDNSTINFGGTIGVSVRNNTNFASATITAELHKDGNYYARLGSVSATKNGITLEPASASSVINKILTGVGAGQYSVKLIVNATGDVRDYSGSISASTLGWSFTQSDVRYFQLGLNGLMAFYSNNHFHYTEDGGLDVRGSVNMPGVLAAGSSTSGGIQSNVWGAKSSTANITPITGGFRVPLSSLSHSNYVVQITPHTNTTFRVSTKTSTYFEVYGTGGFDYVVIGNNYA